MSRDLRRSLSLAVLILLPVAGCNQDRDRIMLAIKNGDKAQVAALLKSEASLANVSYSRNNIGVRSRPLREAADQGNADIARLLLDYGADVNGTTGYGETALHVAAGRSKVDVVELLVARGAAVDARGRSGETPLHRASTGSPAVVLALLAHGAAVNAVNNDGDTPLHFAALDTNLRAAVVLCANGADPAARNAKGQTAADLPDTRPPEL